MFFVHSVVHVSQFYIVLWPQGYIYRFLLCLRVQHVISVCFEIDIPYSAHMFITMRFMIMIRIADISARGPLGPCLRTTRTVWPDYSDRVSWTWIDPMKQDNSALYCNNVNIILIKNTLKCIDLFIYLNHVFRIEIWGKGFRTWLIIYNLIKVR